MTAPAQPEIATRASRRTRLFGITLIATVLVSMLSLPWRLTGLAFGAVALYTGIRLLTDLTALRRAGRPVRGWLGVAVGLGIALFLMMIFAGQAVFYPLFAEQERCTDRAITHLDEEQCRVVFQQRQQEILGRLQSAT